MSPHQDCRLVIAAERARSSSLEMVVRRLEVELRETRELLDAVYRNGDVRPERVFDTDEELDAFLRLTGGHP